jgi:hypothetical protein
MSFKRKRVPAIALGGLITIVPISLGWLFLVAGEADTGAGERVVAEAAATEAIRSIELIRRNWEGNGTDIRIDANGSFVVTAQTLGRTKVVRQGQLDPAVSSQLKTAIKNADLRQGFVEYQAAPESATGWWGYDLVVNTDGQRRVRFHSEDNTVPPAVRELVDALMQATTGR